MGCRAEAMKLIPGSGRSAGKGRDSPLQSSCLENRMDRGAWWAAIEVAEQQRKMHTVNS